MPQVTETHLPSEASIELPKVHVSAEYVQDGNSTREAQFAGMVHQQCLLYFNWTKSVDLLAYLVLFWIQLSAAEFVC